MRPEKRVTARSKLPQKKWTGLHLPRKRPRKCCHHPVGLHQLAPEELRGVAVVGGVRAIALERDGVLDLRRHRPDVNVDAQRAQPPHDLGVEIGHRTRRQRKRVDSPVAGPQQQPVLEKVEVDLQEAALVRHRRRGEPGRGDVERDLPPMVHHGRELEPDLADHLGPQLQRRAGVLPVVVAKVRPRIGSAAGDMIVDGGHHRPRCLALAVSRASTEHFAARLWRNLLSAAPERVCPRPSPP